MTVRQRDHLARRAQRRDASSGQTTGPLFSVILCTYNRRNFVLAALASLRRQTLSCEDFEVIVVDNGSQDGTTGAVSSYVQMEQKQGNSSENSWQVQCLSEPRNGLAHARNTGLLAATGEIAVFIDDDTLVEPHMLERLQRTYEETDADAVGMRVTLHWDVVAPHWMVSELLETLGYFSPETQRFQLASDDHFASSGFSVKMVALRSINYFTPFLSKRADLPASTEVADLCLRLHEAGYTLWYEPEALLLHRATSARLRRAFFVGRAYWQGRSEIMLQYCHTRTENADLVWREIWQEMKTFALCALVQSPLIHLAGRPTTERLLAAMEQAHSWGRLLQRLFYLERIPSELDIPAVLLVTGPDPDASFDLLTQTLDQQEVRYLVGKPEIPIGWLWRHRTYRNQPVGILHFYRPGSLNLTRHESQYLRFRLWLARRWGLRIVVTDSGGWWQSARGSLFRGQRVFERKILHASHAILSSTVQPSLLYRDRRLRRRVRCLPQPGFRGHYPVALPVEEARQHLKLPEKASFVYLCLAYQHTEREIAFLLEAFHLLTGGSRSTESLPDVHLLVVGNPVDTNLSPRTLRLVTHDQQIHLHAFAFRSDDIPLYMGACNALVFPHLAVHTAGNLESAALALSYELLVVAPDLPRFSGRLPQRASVPYIAASRESLAEALIKAQQMKFSLQGEESAALDAQQSWNESAKAQLQIYRELLIQK
jgi:glycosyltransferase involved in cell wall biosynthesis